MVQNTYKIFQYQLVRAFRALIGFYQYFISPLFGPKCRFYPSCSEYALQSVSKFGIIKGIVFSMMRIMRCHPFNPGGYDPIPHKTGKN